MMLSEEFTKVCEDARDHVARSCSPFVLTLEGLGYRLVPASTLAAIVRALDKADKKETG